MVWLIYRSALCLLPPPSSLQKKSNCFAVVTYHCDVLDHALEELSERERGGGELDDQLEPMDAMTMLISQISHQLLTTRALAAIPNG